jgi:deoxyadenosine/deoxycytidine kinase
MSANANYTFISIEGNIGSGKSTLLANLRENYKDNNNVIFLKEPVDEWAKIKDVNGTTILEKFYADQEKYSFSFQMMAYVSRIKVLRDTLKDKKDKDEKDKTHDQDKTHYIIITERSLYTDKMVFAKMLYDSGKIEDVNYQIYLNWFDTFSSEFPVHKVIYVKADPEKCYERIAKRSREGEENIPLEYLTACSLYHDNMLDKSTNSCVCNEQLILDGNIDIYENKTQVKKWIQEIEQYIL